MSHESNQTGTPDKGASRAHRGLDSGARRGGADGHPASRLRGRPRTPGYWPQTTDGRRRSRHYRRLDGRGRPGLRRADARRARRRPQQRRLSAPLVDAVEPPKIIYVSGTIDANVDDANQPLGCTDYYRNGFTIEAFLAAYDPATWGRVNPTGDLENARVASVAAQQARVRIRVGSNTTIVGLGEDATLRGIWLDIRRHSTAGGNPTNIIIRNITFLDTYDCFPQWSPTDGAQGNWNAAYDSISLRDGDHIWIDHNRFADVTTADATLPVYFGRLFQVHDGELDITNATDLVTVSWNHFLNHDKVMLIGSSDNAPADVGKLRVTLHHNLWEGTGQRTPRVRYGQVHIYNNLYYIAANTGFQYAGASASSRRFSPRRTCSGGRRRHPRFAPRPL